MRHVRLRLRIQGASHLCTALSLAGVLVGCGDKADDFDGHDSGGGSDAPTFDEVLTEVLVPSCGFNSCHGSGAGYLHINETTTATVLVNVESRQVDGVMLVAPGDADQSYIIQKLTDASGIQGDPMPPPGGGLDSDRIDMVRDWIDAGAE